ncbi:MAG: hypothetical protein V7642_1418, partial [Burkholderiales bacterium]
HPLVGRYKGMAKPVKFSDTPGPGPFAAPTLGQHSAEILAQHGYSGQEIARLQELGVLGMVPIKK